MQNDLTHTAPFLSDTNLVELLWTLCEEGDSAACAIIHAEMEERFADC